MFLPECDLYRSPYAVQTGNKNVGLSDEEDIAF